MTLLTMKWFSPAASPPSLALSDDQALLQAAKGGDTAAFGQLIRRYQRAVFNVAYRLVGNRPDAEDLAQESFLRAFRAIDRFDLSRPVGPWLKRITTNVCLNWLEMKRVRPESQEADLGEGGLEQWDSHLPGPEQQLLHNEQAGLIRLAILQLPPSYRAVIELRHFQELSYEEMAETLQRPLSSVKSDLFRARKLLAEKLQSSL